MINSTIKYSDDERFQPLVISDFFPSPQCPHEGLCVKEQLAHLPGKESAVLVSPAISYPPMPRYKFLRERRLARGWQGTGEKIYRVPVFYIPLVGEKLILRQLINETTKFIQWTNTSFNIIHANWAYRSGAVALALSRFYGVPFVLTIWGSDLDICLHETRKNASILQVIKNAAALIVQNQMHARKLLDIGADARRIFCLPLGIDTQMFTPASKKHKYNPCTLVMIGNLFKDKGHRVVLRSLSKCKNEVRLKIVGDGPEYESLKKLTVELGVAQQVMFCGMKFPNQIPGILHKSDGLIIGSSHEGAPKVLLEALSCGIPVVSTKVGFAPEIIKKHCGFLVDIGDVEAMARAMDQLATNNWDAVAIRQTVLSFDWQNFKQRMQAIYEFALDEGI